MGFSMQENGSGLPFLPPGDLSDPGMDLSDPGIEATSLVFPALSRQILCQWATWEAPFKLKGLENEAKFVGKVEGCLRDSLHSLLTDRIGKDLSCSPGRSPAPSPQQDPGTDMLLWSDLGQITLPFCFASPASFLPVFLPSSFFFFIQCPVAASLPFSSLRSPMSVQAPRPSSPTAGLPSLLTWISFYPLLMFPVSLGGALVGILWLPPWSHLQNILNLLLSQVTCPTL